MASVVGEYVGGILLILLMWVVVRLTLPHRLVESARERAREAEDTDTEKEARLEKADTQHGRLASGRFLPRALHKVMSAFDKADPCSAAQCAVRRV